MCAGCFLVSRNSLPLVNKEGFFQVSCKCRLISLPLFSFQDFEIQSTRRCSSDWISIGTYKNLDGYRACGSSIPAPYISSQDHVWIKFHSDASETGKGFRLSYITGICYCKRASVSVDCSCKRRIVA